MWGKSPTRSISSTAPVWPLTGACYSGQTRNVARSVHRSRRRRVRELPDCVDDPEPDRYTDGVTSCREFVGSSGALHLGRVAVAFKHQVGDAPDVDLGYHAAKLDWARLERFK